MTPPLACPFTAIADWMALSCYGRERADLAVLTNFTLNGFKLSRRSFIMLYATPSWLQTLFAKD